MSKPFPTWFRYDFMDGKLVGSEHPENLHSEVVEKRRLTRQVAEYLSSEQGIRAVINLTEASWEYGLAGLAVYHCPLSDETLEACPDSVLDGIVSLIHERLIAGDGVWVHCQRGIDRTGCVIGCYLTSLGQPPDGVIGNIKAKWPRYRASSGFDDLWEPVARRIRRYAASCAERRSP